MMTTRVCAIFLATAVAVAALSSVAQAVPVSYTIDLTQSSATTTGWISNVALTFSSQYDTTNTDGLQGTIMGDLNAGVITATAGSVIDYVLHPQSGNPPFFQPAGAGEDNLAIQAANGGFIAAVRNAMFTIPAGGTMQNGVPAAINLQITAGTLYTNFGNGALSGNLPNISLGNVSLSNNGSIETLIIPFQTSQSSTTPSLTITTGQIVATRQIPEPSTMVLAELGVVGIALAAWKRRQA